MRRTGWALVGVTALMVGGLQVAQAGVTCKVVPSWCPVETPRDGLQPKDVPEPATLVLLGAGISAVGAAVLRRRKRKE